MKGVCGAVGLGDVTCQLKEHGSNVMHHARGRDAYGAWVLEWYDPHRLRAMRKDSGRREAPGSSAQTRGNGPLTGGGESP